MRSQNEKAAATERRNAEAHTTTAKASPAAAQAKSLNEKLKGKAGNIMEL